MSKKSKLTEQTMDLKMTNLSDLRSHLKLLSKKLASIILIFRIVQVLLVLVIVLIIIYFIIP